MYVWLVGMLVDTLSPIERPHSITFSMAWHQMLSVALLGVVLFLTTVVRLVWLVLVYCCQGNMLVSHTVLCTDYVWYLDVGQLIPNVDLFDAFEGRAYQAVCVHTRNALPRACISKNRILLPVAVHACTINTSTGHPDALHVLCMTMSGHPHNLQTGSQAQLACCVTCVIAVLKSKANARYTE